MAEDLTAQQIIMLYLSGDLAFGVARDRLTKVIADWGIGEAEARAVITLQRALEARNTPGLTSERISSLGSELAGSALAGGREPKVVTPPGTALGARAGEGPDWIRTSGLFPTTAAEVEARREELSPEQAWASFMGGQPWAGRLNPIAEQAIARQLPSRQRAWQMGDIMGNIGTPRPSFLAFLEQGQPLPTTEQFRTNIGTLAGLFPTEAETTEEHLARITPQPWQLAAWERLAGDEALQEALLRQAYAGNLSPTMRPYAEQALGRRFAAFRGRGTGRTPFERFTGQGGLW